MSELPACFGQMRTFRGCTEATILTEGQCKYVARCWKESMTETVKSHIDPRKKVRAKILQVATKEDKK